MAGANTVDDRTRAPGDVGTKPWLSYPKITLPPILEAALDDFKQNGYHGTTVRSIAAGVGLTMPSLYYHYGNKEGILVALLDIAMEDLLSHIDNCLAEADDVVTKLRNFVTVVALHNTRRRDLALLHDEFRFLGTDARTAYVAKRSQVQETLEDILRTGVDEGVFADDDPHFTSRVLLGMLSGILDWYSENGPLSAAEIAERYTDDAVRIVRR